jgi:hypothetical protein
MNGSILTPQRREDVQRYGYFTARKLFDDEEIALLRADEVIQ